MKILTKEKRIEFLESRINMLEEDIENFGVCGNDYSRLNIYKKELKNIKNI